MSWIRDVMYERIRPTMERITTGDFLFLGGDSQLRSYLSSEVRVRITNFPEVDIEDTGFGEESWDYILSDQVLEHLRHPWRAAEEIHRILRPGGLAIVTTCAYNPVHKFPIDCYRFLPQGLEALFEAFELVEVGAWGSRLAMIQDILRPDCRHQVDPNVKEFCKAQDDGGTQPWVTWIIVRKVHVQSDPCAPLE